MDALVAFAVASYVLARAFVAIKSHFSSPLPGRCYELATGSSAGFLGPFPIARRLRAFYRLGRRPGHFGISFVSLGVSRVYDCKVEQVGQELWHVVPWETGFTLADIPDHHRVGAEAALGGGVKVVWSRADIAREFTRAVVHSRYAVSSVGRVEAHLAPGAVELEAELVATELLRMGIRNAETLADLTEHAASVFVRKAHKAAKAGGERLVARGEKVVSCAAAAARKAGRGTARVAHLPMDAAAAAVGAVNAVDHPSSVVRRLRVFTAPVWRMTKLGAVHRWRPLEGLSVDCDPDAEQVPGIDHFVALNKVDRIEAVKLFNSATDVLGEAAERFEVAGGAYKTGITSAIPPSHPNYGRLARLVGPLAHRPKIEGHKEANTLRRAAMAQASRALEGAIVGLIAPNHAMMHTFPNAAVWRRVGSGIDIARQAKHCTFCKAPECRVVAAARTDGRVSDTNSLKTAASFFKRFGVQSLFLVHVEPELEADDLLGLMVEANIWNGYSLISRDWRVLVSGNATDDLIGMTTTARGSKVISSFHDSGTYVDERSSVVKLFRPTGYKGHAMRRTVLFGEKATWYFELNVSTSSVATRCVPGVEKYYFLRIPSPDGVDNTVMVERDGFDRVLSTYRTQAIKDIETAKICLRQSTVTYSIAGTQVTPRLPLTNTQFEALAVWIVVYSEVQDSVAKRTSVSLTQPGTSALLTSTVWGGVKERLTATAAGRMALGSYSAVEEALGAYRRHIEEKSLDELSETAMLEIFGDAISTTSAGKTFLSRWIGMPDLAQKAWTARKAVSGTLLASWRKGFHYADLAVVAGLLGIHFSVETFGMLLDFLTVILRFAGHVDSAASLNRFVRHTTWSKTKAEHFWVAAQGSQKLDFQAAAIDIVETFYNTFSEDWAAEFVASEEYRREDEAHRVLDEQARLPYSDFLSEVKTFLGRYNLRSERLVATGKLLLAFQNDKRHASASQKARMVHALKAEGLPRPAVASPRMHFALGDEPTLTPIPIRLQGRQGLCTDIREVFGRNEQYELRPVGNIASTMQRLQVVDGVVDFTPIHQLMDSVHPNGQVNPANDASLVSLSPDERGGELQERMIQHAVQNRQYSTFCDEDALRPWLTRAIAESNLEPVTQMLESCLNGNMLATTPRWVAHVDGLAMGGKSAGIRRWITNEDLVVVPTKKLRAEWLEALGKLDPLRRATVVTQHEALVKKYTTGFVIVDEAYTFDPQHLQLISNRHRNCKGIITVGDGHQIQNVFKEEGGISLDPSLVRCKMIVPVSFTPWDVMAVYLSLNAGPIRAERYYCGSSSATGLMYVLRGDETLIPGDGDLALAGTQNCKKTLVSRGLPDAITAHESQGARSQHTIIQTAGTLRADLAWFGRAEFRAHLGVAITRARVATVVVVDALGELTPWNWVDVGVNGVLPTTCIYGGTFWDLVDPRVIDEALETYVHDAQMKESFLIERPLTNPITIGTIFAGGEPVAKSELRVNVELTDGVRFTDLGIKASDDFDNYTLQPRDAPGVDQITALQRAQRRPKPTIDDFMNAEVIVNRIMDQVIDPKVFFAHVNNSRRCAIARRERHQVIDGCYAETETRRSALSFAFLKPEYAKKASELADGGELKAQGIITASPAQQAVFMDACDALTHAWARSMRTGKYSPVGFKEQDIDAILTTFESSVEFDLEKQDSSHRAVHVLVACRFLELAADKLGLKEMALEIRTQRTVRMMQDPFTFVLQMSLASGDPWTLIFNKIMAVSSLVSVCSLNGVRMLQTGDDITLDRQPDWDHEEGYKAQHSANRGLTWKREVRTQRESGVTFISRGALPNRTVVYKALRTVLKYTTRRRTRLQHAAYGADTRRLLAASARLGLQAYVEARCRVFGGEPDVVYCMWTRAIALAQMPFDNLPESLRDDSEKAFDILSRDTGCFGYALAQVIGTNVQAINAIAKYSRVTPTEVAKQACRDNKVPYVIVDEAWALRSRQRLTAAVQGVRFSLKRAFVALYRDHAVAVKPKELVVHSAVGKQTFTWKTLHVNGLTQYDGL